MSTSNMASGRLSREEWDFISTNYGTMTIEDIASSLRRRPIVIKKFIEENISRVASDKTIKYDLQRRLYWEELSKQFSKEELTVIEHYWIAMIKQFNEDVLPTEELQILDCAKIEILMNRNLRDRHRSEEEIERMSTLLKDLYNIDRVNRTQTDIDTIARFEQEIQVRRNGQQARTREYTDLQKHKNDIFKSMKATRDQRHAQAQEHRETFFQFMRDMDKQEVRDRQAEEMELVRLASQMEKERLAQYEQYADGVIDKPILNSETVE